MGHFFGCRLAAGLAVYVELDDQPKVRIGLSPGGQGLYKPKKEISRKLNVCFGLLFGL